VPVFNLVKNIFPSVEKADVFIALSEVFSHLEVLESEKKVEVKDPGPPIIYRAL
jgi:hypothetical protein